MPTIELAAAKEIAAEEMASKEVTTPVYEVVGADMAAPAIKVTVAEERASFVVKATVNKIHPRQEVRSIAGRKVRSTARTKETQ